MPANIVYYATDDGDGTATAHNVTAVPASTPMLVKGDANTIYHFSTTSDDVTAIASNAFIAGSNANVASNPSANVYNYILNGDTWYAANDKYVATNKAYLQLSRQAHARVLKFADDEATGINAIEKNLVSESYFDLQGRRVAQPTKGLYIVNGKKVVMK